MSRTLMIHRLRLRIGRRKAIEFAVLAVMLAAICAGGAVWRATWIGRRLLHNWVVGAIDKGSGGVYQLRIGHVHYDWSFPPGIAVDSFALATRRALNEHRPQPLPGLRLALYRCAIRGVGFFNLVFSGGLVAESFGCESGSLMVQMPRRAHIARAARAVAQARLDFEERQAFLVLQQAVRLPSYAPRIRIKQVVFPRLALDVRLPRTAIGAIGLELEQLEWSMTDVVIDPGDSTAASRPLFSRRIELGASNFVTHPDRATAVRVGLLRTSLTDSTIEVRNVTFEPSQSGAAFRRGRRDRHDLIKLAVGSISADGIDFGAFFVGQGVRARRVEMDSFRLDLTSDKRLPDFTPGTPHRTPQRWVADLDETVSVDSIRVRNGEVIYRQHALGRERPGVISFTNIEAAGANMSHFVGRRTSSDPMTLTVRAQIQHTGQLDLRVTVPLDAPQFDMRLRGVLGPMSALDFNPLVAEIGSVRIEHGQVAGATFNVVVKSGVASGTITPLFSDLSVSVTRKGSTGILGNGGIFGGAVRGIASFAANEMMVRNNNPDGTNPPLTGAIHHVYVPRETLIKFVWMSLRDGLLSVIKK
jgi:hypothetical protein